MNLEISEENKKLIVNALMFTYAALKAAKSNDNNIPVKIKTDEDVDEDELGNTTIKSELNISFSINDEDKQGIYYNTVIESYRDSDVNTPNQLTITHKSSSEYVKDFSIEITTFEREIKTFYNLLGNMEVAKYLGDYFSDPYNYQMDKDFDSDTIAKEDKTIIVKEVLKPTLQRLWDPSLNGFSLTEEDKRKELSLILKYYNKDFVEYIFGSPTIVSPNGYKYSAIIQLRNTLLNYNYPEIGVELYYTFESESIESKPIFTNVVFYFLNGKRLKYLETTVLSSIAYTELKGDLNSKASQLLLDLGNELFIENPYEWLNGRASYRYPCEDNNSQKSYKSFSLFIEDSKKALS